MLLRPAIALAALLLAHPAAASDPIDIEPNFDPEIAWFDFPVLTRGASGRVRLISADGQADAALSVDEYYFYQLEYRKALSDLTMRLSLTQADPLARRQAFLETLREFPDIQVNVQGGVLTDIEETLRLVPSPINSISRR
ncbi:MAG: hypothetical protein AAGF30_09980 [Pseudomonadota bacterium]